MTKSVFPVLAGTNRLCALPEALPFSEALSSVLARSLQTNGVDLADFAFESCFALASETQTRNFADVV